MRIALPTVGHALGLWIPLALASVPLSCGSSGSSTANPEPPNANDASADGSSHSDASTGTDGTVPILDSATPTGCSPQNPCEAGVCLQGKCCANQDKVCGEQCCEDSQVCFANACVIPGNPCHSAQDCAPNQYCEPSLGQAQADAGPDASPQDSGPQGDSDSGPMCLQPAPRPGRCLSLPPKCQADAGSNDAGACIPECEYHPEVAKLQAQVKWKWGPEASQYPNFIDVWATPTVGRAYDTNCDGAIDELDPPNIIFVSGNARGTCCGCGDYAPSTCLTGVLRMLDGASGKEIWSLRKASNSSIGFAGLSVALGDIDNDGRIDIAAVTGEGNVAIIDGDGHVKRISSQVIPNVTADSFGWGGGLALADMDGDGHSEIAYGSTVFSSTDDALPRLFVGNGGNAGGANKALSTFVDLDGAADGHLELLAGNTAYKADGTQLWRKTDLPNGFPGVGDFNADGAPEAVLVGEGKVWLLSGATGDSLLDPATLSGTGGGGPPTVADFDGDGTVEIGVAQQNFYSVVKPNFAEHRLEVLWQSPNHDLSSNVTGSTVFDFEGDGAAEVIYNDECFLWVYDGKTGHVRFATPTTSFTATEASLVADVDGDGHAEIVMVANGADPGPNGWKCNITPWNEPNTDPDYARPAWAPPPGSTVYRGLTVFEDKAHSWVGTRTLWNQHTYHVSNICDNRDSACDAPNHYGSIPAQEKSNWTVPWLNNFRQNVQDKGIFNAPDATVSMSADCKEPLELHAHVRNLGFAILPEGVQVGIYVRKNGSDRLLSTQSTTTALFPGQVETLSYQALASDALSENDLFVAKILIDPTAPGFHECRADNNESPEAQAHCTHVR